MCKRSKPSCVVLDKNIPRTSDIFSEIEIRESRSTVRGFRVMLRMLSPSQIFSEPKMAKQKSS